MNATDLLIISLATWRLAYFVSKENAPFDAMKRLRERFPLGGGTACIYCVSIWTAIGSWLLLQTLLYPLVYIAAASGGAMMLWRYTGGEHG